MKIRKLLLALVATFCSVFNPAVTSTFAQQGNAVPQPSRSGARFYAASYGKWAVHTTSNTAAGAATINVDNGAPFLGSGFGGGVSDSGRFINAFQNSFPFGGGFIKISVDSGTANEVVTLTGSTSCVSQNNQNLGTGQLSTCSLTASSFANAHGQGAFVFSGTAGLQEAINDAAGSGGGVVVVDSSWSLLGGTTAMLAAASVAQNVLIEDDRAGAPIYWYPFGGATTLAAPATLVSTTAGFGVNGAGFTGGFYTGSSTYIACIAYVDILGQEGPCSASFTIVTSGVATTDQIGFTAPAASAGAVGYTIYIDLAGGSYTNSYKVPLVNQPTVVGAALVNSGVCTLTTIETVTPACALANTTYGQTGVGAVVSALTLNTSPIEPQLTVISTTSVYVPQPGGRTTYTYAPGGTLGAGGQTVASELAFPLTAAAATAVPAVLGTINLAPNVMNVVGKKLRICGEATTTASAATTVDIQFQWDAMGQNTAGKGVLIGDLTALATIATTGHAGFCQDFVTTVASASATGGSINHVNGFGGLGGVTTAATGAFADSVTPGAVGSLNLAVDARINVIYLHSTATDGAGWILQNVTAQLL
jgi:hypothetical protein